MKEEVIRPVWQTLLGVSRVANRWEISASSDSEVPTIPSTYFIEFLAGRSTKERKERVVNKSGEIWRIIPTGTRRVR